MNLFYFFESGGIDGYTVYIHELSSIIYIMEQTTVWYKHEILFLKGKIIECALYTDNIKELSMFALINKRCSVLAKQRIKKNG